MSCAVAPHTQDLHTSQISDGARDASGCPVGPASCPRCHELPKAYLSPVWPTGGPGGVPDPHLQDGAAAAAAAGGSAGGAGECHRAEPAGQAHQHPPGRHGGPFGLRVHGRQLCGPAHEDSQQDVQHVTPRGVHRLSLEALGRPPGLRAALLLLLTQMMLPAPGTQCSPPLRRVRAAKT